jgi:cell division protein FtsZ
VASVARSLGALTIGVVTRPFGFEGKRRAGQADSGIERLRSEVDTLIVIPNDRLLSISDRHVSVLDAFKAADQVLLSGVQGITDLITTPGLINLDFADVKSVMSGAGSALMGIGSARGDDRSVAAAEMAISSPLLEASIDGAHGVLLSIQGGSDLGLFEINEAAQLVSNSAAPDANIIFGAVIDDALGDEVRVTVIAAGFDEPQDTRPRVGRLVVGSSAGGGAARPADIPSVPAVSSPSSSSAWRTSPSPSSASSASAPAERRDSSSASSAPPARADSGAANPADRTDRADRAGESAESPAGAGESRGGESRGAESVDGVPPPRPAESAPAATADQPAGNGSWPADGSAQSRGLAAEAASTRRRSVVFEEDDELDVPDFLK